MNRNNHRQSAFSKAKKKPRCWVRKQQRGKLTQRLPKNGKRLIPDDAIRRMCPIQGLVCRIRCVSVRSNHVYTGFFTCNFEQNKLFCERIFREKKHANKYHREWCIYDGAAIRTLSPEEDCNEKNEQLRFSSVKSQGFYLLRAMILHGDVSTAPGASSDFDKIYYSLDKNGRYVVSSEAAPLAELFAMAALFITEERGNSQTNTVKTGGKTSCLN